MLCVGDMAHRLVETGKDPSGLGRWTWMKFTGRQHTTRIITAYMPNKGSRMDPSTVYKQHSTFWESMHINDCPRHLLQQQLLDHLLKWRDQGDRLLLLIDANQDVRDSPLTQALNCEGLHMREVVQARHQDLPTTPTQKSGSVPIDGIYATPDLPITSGTLLGISGLLGDHRFVSIDIPWDLLLGEDIHKIVRPQARRLSCRIPQAMKNYTTSLSLTLRQHRYLQRLNDIQSHAGTTLTPSQQTELTILDNIRTSAMLQAERHCRKLKMGEVAYSPEIDAARRLVELWRAVHKKRSGGKVNSLFIRRMARKCGITSPLNYTMEQAKSKLETAKKDYYALKPNSKQYRADWLHARSRDTTLDDTSRKAAKRMIREEIQRETYSLLRYTLRGSRGGSVRTVTTTEPDGTNRQHTTEEAVVQEIMVNNEARFRLTESTPPMQPPLLNDLGYTGTTQEGLEILAGSYEPDPTLDQWTTQFLEALEHTDPARPPINTTISASDYQAYWRRAKEKTSSSYSGLHFGHWKAAASNNYLSECHALSTELAYSSGFSFPRWQAGLSAMLEKQKGNDHVDKLRAILLMEADFNFANKLYFGSRMIRQAEQYDQIPDELFGSRRGRTAIEVAMSRRLIADLSRQRRWPTAIASVDAHTCYDRIVHSIASLCCQRWDTPPLLPTAMFHTIQHMQFHLRTGHGDSDESYGYQENAPPDTHPIQGICQGNGAGPAVWLAVSAPLVTAQRSQGHGARFVSAVDNSLVEDLVGLLFVDDTDLIATAEAQQEPAETVIQQLQDSVTDWQGHLRTTGGSLKLGKCSWCIAAYMFRDGVPHYHTPTSLPADIALSIGQPGTQTAAITRHSPSTAIKVVGVIQAMDGSMTAQRQELIQSASIYGQRLRSSYLTQQAAWLGFNSMIWPSLRYCLPATTFTPQESRHILTPLYKHLLPKLGCVSTIPLQFRYAPPSMFGLGLPDVYVEQGIAQLKFFTAHRYGNTSAGRLLDISLAQLQLEVGCEKEVLTTPFSGYGHLATKSWLASLWQFISTYSIDLRLSDAISNRPRAARENDTFLMDLYHRLDLLSKSEMRSFNRVRLYLGVITMADLTTGDGKHIRNTFFDRPRPTNHDYPSTYIWQREEPTSGDFNLWRKALGLLCAPGTRQLLYEYQVQEWINPQHHCSNWPWLYDPIESRLYKQWDNMWQRFRPLNDRNIRYGRTFTADGAVTVLPPHQLQRATATRTRNPLNVIFEGSSPYSMEIRQILPNSPTQIPDFIEWWPLLQSTFPDDPEPLVNAIKTGTAIGASDGSYMPLTNDSLGAAAWKIEDPMTKTQCRGTCPTSGKRCDVNAYRSELQGIHAALLAVLLLSHQHGITDGAVTLGCDNETGVDLSNRVLPTVQWQTRHVDLIRGIQCLQYVLSNIYGVEVTFQHVAGHQDDILHYNALPRLAQLNIDCDIAAKEALLSLVQNPHPVVEHPIFGEGWACYIPGHGKITKTPEVPLRQHILGRQLMSFQIDKGRFTKAGVARTDWEGIQDATATFPSNVLCLGNKTCERLLRGEYYYVPSEGGYITTVSVL